MFYLDLNFYALVEVMSHVKFIFDSSSFKVCTDNRLCHISSSDFTISLHSFSSISIDEIL